MLYCPCSKLESLKLIEKMNFCSQNGFLSLLTFNKYQKRGESRNRQK